MESIQSLKPEIHMPPGEKNELCLYADGLATRLASVGVAALDFSSPELCSKPAAEQPGSGARPPFHCRSLRETIIDISCEGASKYKC
jgi:hypothetical protein